MKQSKGFTMNSSSRSRRHSLRRFFIITFVSACALVSSLAISSPGYFRYPALHGTTVVFTAEGDLWKVDLKEGDLKHLNLKHLNLKQGHAIRLTSHPAEEKEAAISPDGKLVAYTARYEGTTEVYVIPMMGGVPKRVSYESSRVRLHHWTRDGKILYSANNHLGPPGNWTLRAVDPVDMSVATLPLADAVEGVIDDAGENVYFVQFGDQVSRDNLKFYRGGAAGQLWKYSLGGNREATRLTQKHRGSVREPMLARDRLYFISDESGNSNIWSMNLKGGEQKQITDYTDWPVRTASVYQNKIVYQLGADIKLLNLESGTSEVVDIRLNSDFPGLSERWIKKPLNYMSSAILAGDHDKVVLTARGKVAIASIDNSRLVEVATHLSGRIRQAILSHDGQYLYAISDASGEHEIWQFSATGSEDFTQLTSNGNTLRWNLVLSPDGKWIAHDDKHGELWLLNLATHENKKIAEAGVGLSPYELSWSRDSQFLAFARNRRGDERSRISLYSLNENKQQVLTSDDYESYAPAFSADGDWLYFLSERHFRATPRTPWGDRNMGPSFDRRALIFAYGLNESAEFPFREPDELRNVTEVKETEPDTDGLDENDLEHNTEGENKDEAKLDEVVKSTVDWATIDSRLWQVPVPSGNYSDLKINDRYLYVLDKVTEPGAKASVLSIKQEPFSEPVDFKNGVEAFGLSDDGKKMFVRLTGRDNANQFIVNAGARFPSKVAKARVKTSDWQIALQPKHEWHLMFKDAWLMHREYLFDPNMRGVDWSKVKSKYEPLLDRITDRYELDDVLRHMSGEVSTLHSQVGGGDYPRHENSPAAATLGALYESTPEGVQVKHIYQSDPEMPAYLAPLAKPGVDVSIGDVIAAVNGDRITTVFELHKALRNKAGKQVLLELKRDKKAIQAIVLPTTAIQDYRARYRDWTYGNRMAVTEANSGIGYLHLAAMGARDVASFARDFYANYDRDGLIIDVRRNRGGNIDSWIIEKLLRRVWSFWQPRDGNAWSNMQQTFRGHLVVLTDEMTYSDGETFAAGIKALNLGTVMGRRTTGAGVWLTNRNRLVDRGITRVAEYPVFAMDGRCVNEGVGVEPDVEVVNYPHATFIGEDAQLNSAIRYLEKEIKKKPIPPMKASELRQNLKPADLILRNSG
jgi:tricorn protease